MVREYNINMSDFINGNVSMVMKIAYKYSNAIVGVLWKCGMISELIE